MKENPRNLCNLRFKIAESSVISVAKSARVRAGFSLIEVLFAVLVLTLGLIFVAAQFPLGLSMARRSAEQTVSAVNNHNAAIQTKLQLQQLFPANGPISPLVGTGIEKYLNQGVLVYYLCRPNARNMDLFELSNNFAGVFLDDPSPLDVYLSYGVDRIPEVNELYGHPGGAGTEFVPGMFRLASDVPAFPAFGVGQPAILLPRNMGLFASPPVDESDVLVQERIANTGVAYDTSDVDFQMALDRAIFDVTVNERNYNWAAFYKYVGTGTGDNRFHFYIFTLRHQNKDLLYAVQDLTVTDPTEKPVPFGEAQARIFPIPWAVSFPTVVGSWAGTTDTFELATATGLTVAAADSLFKNYLRVGTFILEASKGDLYEISELSVDSNGNYLVRLNRDLVSTIQSFWFFPPGVDSSNNWVSQQPVVSVQEFEIAL